MEKQDIEQESFIQKWAPYLVAGVLVVAVGFYISQFHNGLSNDQGTWGEFGDFVGGAVNPIIGFFTIWLLAVSLRQNHKALSQANTALVQAKQELELTRKAIDDSRVMQQATERALNEQLKLAANTRDMNNAFVLWKHYAEQRESLYQRIEEVERYNIHANIYAMKAEHSEMARYHDLIGMMLLSETTRLIEMYCPQDKQNSKSK